MRVAPFPDCEASPADAPAKCGTLFRAWRRGAVFPWRVRLPCLQLAAMGGIVGATLFAAPQQPAFRAQVNLIEIDAVATDAAGKPVLDLEQEEFQLLEDGTPHDIVAFSRVNLPIPPAHTPAVVDIANNVRASDGRLYFLILDDIHTLRDQTGNVRAVARRLIERLAPQDSVGVLWLSLQKGGAQEFSTNHSAVLQAIDAFFATDTRIARGNPRGIGLPDFTDPDDRPSSESQRSADVNRQLEFERIRPFLMIHDVCDHLASLRHRRKALVYVGQGPVAAMLGADSSGGADSDVEMRRAITAARRSNVAVYAIDPDGAATAGVEVSPDSDVAKSFRELATTRRDTMATLGIATGGFASAGSIVFDAIDRIIADTSCYYLLGYYADPPPGRAMASALKAFVNPWHGFRSVEVRTTRPGVRVRARKGYWAGDLAEPPVSAPAPAIHGTATLAASGLLPQSDLSLRAFAAPFRGADGRNADIAITVEVGAAEFAPQDGRAAFHEMAEMTIVAIEPGEKVRLTERVSARMSLSPDKAGALLDKRYLLCARISLSSGNYQLRIGVQSARAGRSGSVYLDLRVPELLAAPVSLSGLVLDQSSVATPPPAARVNSISSTVPFLPSLAREFTSADNVSAYVRAYQGKGRPRQEVWITTVIDRVGDGQTVWSAEESRPPTAFGPLNEAEFRVRLPLAQLQPGDYRLRLTASGPDRRSLASRELDFRMRVAPAAGAPSLAVGVDLGLQSVLALAASYVASYFERLSAVVAEEYYEQTLQRRVTSGFAYRGQTLIRSDYLLVRVESQGGLTPFRDVFEVNGQKVRDRDNRLQALFLERRNDALDTARRILEEGARYNIGSLVRNINHPVLPLLFLRPDSITGFLVSRHGEEQIAGVLCWRLDYEEISRPTVISQGSSDRDMPSTGSFWIDPHTGRVLKTMLKTVGGRFTMETTVTYRQSDVLDLLVPFEMQEVYTTAAERILGKATYQNFRRFQVSTSEQIK